MLSCGLPFMLDGLFAFSFIVFRFFGYMRITHLLTRLCYVSLRCLTLTCDLMAVANFLVPLTQ